MHAASTPDMGNSGLRTEMIKYEKSMEFTGDFGSAMKMANTIFASNGFKINQIDETHLSIIGPGMNSTKQNPIRGLGRGALTFTGTTLEFTGELGGIESMKKFLYFFPPALGIGMAVLFAFTRHDINAGLTPLLTVAPWIIISPIIFRYIQKKTGDAIATALENISRAK